MTTSKIIINARREKPIQQQHPWIFSRAIAEAHNASPGDVVSVYSHKGDFLARGSSPGRMSRLMMLGGGRCSNAPSKAAKPTGKGA
jgi:23S rRNA G2069 N7-methylase RlmK/C1962 C5-methylase RlmI